MEDKQPEMMRFAHKSFKFPSDVSKLRSKWRVGARLIDLDVFSEGDISSDKCHGGGISLWGSDQHGSARGTRLNSTGRLKKWLPGRPVQKGELQALRGPIRAA